MSTTAIPQIDAPGLVRVGLPELVYGDTPAANTDFTYTIQGQYLQRVVSVFCRLVADANVASREVVVSYEDQGGNRFGLAGINTAVTANNTGDYAFSVLNMEAIATVDSSALVPLPGFLMLPTQRVKIHLVNGQAADQLSRIRLVVEKFYTTGLPERRGYDTGPR